MTTSLNKTLALPDESNATLTVANPGGWQLPAQIGRADEKTQRRFLEFFAASICNKNTRGLLPRSL